MVLTPILLKDLLKTDKTLIKSASGVKIQRQLTSFFTDNAKRATGW
jgi:hypothetical protein